jgi:hypothetical protein
MNWGRLYVGSIIVAIGVLFLLDNADVLDAGDVIGDWWPVAIVGAGVLMWATNPGHWLAPLIVTGVGVGLLLSTLDVAEIGSFIWPAVLVVVGLSVIFGRRPSNRSSDTGNTVNSFNMFSGAELASHSQSFEGGSISAIFGAAEVDLRDAHLSPDAELEVFAAFGGVEVRVPEGWAVNIGGLPLFGAWENKTAKEALPANAPTLKISATVLFGGLEVKH